MRGLDTCKTVAEGLQLGDNILQIYAYTFLTAVL